MFVGIMGTPLTASSPLNSHTNIVCVQPNSDGGSYAWPPIGDTGAMATAPEPEAELITTLA